MRQILYYSYSFRATGGGRRGQNRIKHTKRTQTKTSQMSPTWWGPMVTLSVLEATVNYLLTPWTQQSSWARCNLCFLCVCVTEVFAKQGREQKRDSLLLEWRHVSLQFSSWHSKGKFLFLPLSTLQWLALKPIPDVPFWLLVGKAIHPDIGVLPFQQVRPHGWCHTLNPVVRWGKGVPVPSRRSPLSWEHTILWSWWV